MVSDMKCYLFVFATAEKKIWTVKNKTEKTALKLIMLMIPTGCTFHGIINDVVITAIALSSSNSVGFRDGSRKFRKRVNRSTQPRISLVKYRRRRAAVVDPWLTVALV